MLRRNERRAKLWTSELCINKKSEVASAYNKGCIEEYSTSQVEENVLHKGKWHL